MSSLCLGIVCIVSFRAQHLWLAMENSMHTNIIHYEYENIVSQYLRYAQWMILISIVGAGDNVYFDVSILRRSNLDSCMQGCAELVTRARLCWYLWSRVLVVTVHSIVSCSTCSFIITSHSSPAVQLAALQVIQKLLQGQQEIEVFVVMMWIDIHNQLFPTYGHLRALLLGLLGSNDENVRLQACKSLADVAAKPRFDVCILFRQLFKLLTGCDWFRSSARNQQCYDSWCICTQRCCLSDSKCHTISTR